MSQAPKPDAPRNPFAAAESFDEAVGRSVAAWRKAHSGGEAETPAPAEAPELLPPDLTEEEAQILGGVDRSLRRGGDLYRWWKRTSAASSFAQRFDLTRPFNHTEASYGFFDEAPLEGEPLPVMGNYQKMLYDQLRTVPITIPDRESWLNDQLREFVLRYFMRISDFREPEPATDRPRRPLPFFLRPLSICPPEIIERRGFGFTQLFYKERHTGRVGRFPEERRNAIVDLREVIQRYSWIVLKVDIFDFVFEYRPFGEAGPIFGLPLAEESYLALSPEFVEDVRDPAGPSLGRYALGYSFLRNPKEGLLAYGPGEFEAAIEVIRFELDPAGRTRVEMVFVSNRPQRIMNLSLDPVDWAARFADLFTLGTMRGVTESVRQALDVIPRPRLRVDPVFGGLDLLNRATAGVAGRELCLERTNLEFEFLVKHFVQHYQTVAGSLHTWRRFPNWLDEDSLPRWVVEGTSS